MNKKAKGLLISFLALGVCILVNWFSWNYITNKLLGVTVSIFGVIIPAITIGMVTPAGYFDD